MGRGGWEMELGNRYMGVRDDVLEEFFVGRRGDVWVRGVLI